MTIVRLSNRTIYSQHAAKRLASSLCGKLHRRPKRGLAAYAKLTPDCLGQMRPVAKKRPTGQLLHFPANKR